MELKIDYYKNIVFEKQDLDSRLFSPQHKPTIAQLKKVLIKYQIALISLKEVLNQLIKENDSTTLISFDPHVGDTCCEIRAYWLTLFLRNNFGLEAQFNIPMLIKDIDRALNLTSDIISIKLKERGCFNNFDSTTLYKDFFNYYELNLNLVIPDEIRYLHLCYFLTIARKASFSFGHAHFTDQLLVPACLKKTAYDLSTNIYKDLVKSAQAELSKSSVLFIQKQLAELSVFSQELKNDLCCALAENGCCLSEGVDRKETAAYFPMLLVLYASALQNEIPIVLRILKFSKETKGFSRIYQFYLPDKENFMFKAVDDQDVLKNYKNHSALILEALSFNGSNDEFKEFIKNEGQVDPLHDPTSDLSFIPLCTKLKKIDLLHVLWSDASMHPQFAHKKDQDIEHDNIIFKCFDNKENSLLGPLMHILQNDAKEIGCCEKNMNLFYLKHIYANLVGAALS